MQMGGRLMKKRISKWISAAVVAAICVLTIGFLSLFTRSADNMATYLTWQDAWVVAADGSETPFDNAHPEQPLPLLPEGSYYRIVFSLPATTYETLQIECNGMELCVMMDGEELARASGAAMSDSAGLTQLQIPLPAGPDGRTIELYCRPFTTDTGLSRPLPRLYDATQADIATMAYSNLSGIPAGALGLAFATICFLFILNLQTGHADARLLLLAFSAASLMVQQLSVSFGSYFLPAAILPVTSSNWLRLLSAAAMLVYLLLHRDRTFWRSMAWVTGWSAGVLLAWYGYSSLRHGVLARYLNEQLASLFSTGYYGGLLYWLTLWLVGVCTLLSALTLLRFISQTQAQARALSLKNSLVLDSYQAIERKMRDSASMRHEMSHQITALDAMYQTGDMEGLGRYLDELKSRSTHLTQSKYSDHFVVNAILQDASARADDAGVRFEASALLPSHLSIPTEDLCSLLMNMLDNALEACAAVQPPSTRFIQFHAKCKGGFLAIQCKNSRSGTLQEDSHGRLISTKPDPDAHGFGLPQMSAIAQKYHSILDISYTANTFTVQTALKLPDEAGAPRRSEQPPEADA